MQVELEVHREIQSTKYFIEFVLASVETDFGIKKGRQSQISNFIMIDQIMKLHDDSNASARNPLDWDNTATVQHDMTMPGT